MTEQTKPIELMYCENAECRVETYNTKPNKNTNQPVENCPDCGQFGRKKGKN
jgi:hypothetical protein